MRESAGRSAGRAEHPEEAQGVEVERVGERQQVKTCPRDPLEHRELEGARERGEELGELAVEVSRELGVERHRHGVGSARAPAGPQ